MTNVNSALKYIFKVLNNGVEKPALHVAALMGRLDLVKTLIRKGEDVEERSGDGKSALHYAVMSGNLDVVKYLMEEQGMDINLSDDNGLTPSDYALMCLASGLE